MAFSTCVRGAGNQRPFLSPVAAVCLSANTLRVYRHIPSKGRAQPCCNASPVSPVLILCTQLTAKPPRSRVPLGKHSVLWQQPVHSVTTTSAFTFTFLQALLLPAASFPHNSRTGAEEPNIKITQTGLLRDSASHRDWSEGLQIQEKSRSLRHKASHWLAVT